MTLGPATRLNAGPARIAAPAPLTRAASLYLDVWRLFAAMVVFLGHVSGERFTGGLFWQFGPFMGQAVTLFFVLSGFVIAYATSRQEETARSYALSRLARIYSVALPALLLTFVLDSLGRAARPDLYSASWGYSAEGQAWQFVSGLVFANQLWTLDIPQGSDLPYWSLGYEVWYYVIFGLAAFSPVRWRILTLALALVLVGPAIAAMLPLWLLGLWAYRVCARGGVGPRAGWTLLVGTLLAGAVYEAWGRGPVAAFVEIPGILKRPGLVDDYIVGVLFTAHLIGFVAISPAFAALAIRVQKPIRWAAGATFTIYLLHLPVAQFLTTQTPWPPAAWGTRAIMYGGTLLALFAMAEITERRKAWWRGAFDALLSRILPPV